MSNDVSAAHAAIEIIPCASPNQNTAAPASTHYQDRKVFQSKLSKLTFCCRHRRTHDRSDGAESGLPLSGEDEDEFSSEDHLGSLEDASPQSDGGYMSTSLGSLSQNNHALSNGGLTHTTTFNPLQTLSMPMTISTPSGAI
jgi:hypothetical protein